MTRRVALRRALERILLGAGPIAAAPLMLLVQIRLHVVALDYQKAYYPAAERLLHGLSPYATTHAQMLQHVAFVYPAFAAFAAAPFALLGRAPSEFLFAAVCAACVPATLRTLRVRDWRIYGIAMWWLPVYVGWETANLTLPLMLLIALAWRHRERPLVTGLLVAAAVSLKPFVWPLALWLLVTRRFRAAAWTVACGLAINAAGFAIVGFGQVRAYLHLSNVDSGIMWRDGYSVIAAAYHLGAGRTGGEAALVVASLALAAMVARLGWRGRERDALTAAVALMLVASPLVWSHYFALLLIPLALARPRLSPVWAAPLAMWVCPASIGVHGWQLLLAWVVTALCVRAASRSAPSLPATGRVGAFGSVTAPLRSVRGGRMLD